MKNTILIIFAFTTLLGCTSMQAVDQGSTASVSELIADPEAVKIGDKVQIALFDGTVYKGKVERISADSITVGESELAIADIEGIKTRRFSAGKTTALVGGMTIATLAVISAATGAVLAIFGM